MKNRRFQSIAAVLVVLAGVATLAAVSVTAEESDARTTTAEDARITQEPATPEQIAAIRSELAPLFDQSSSAPDRQHESGAIIVDLDGRFQHVVLMRTNPDGSQERICTRSLDDAVAFLTGEPTAGHRHDAPAAD